MQRPHAATGSPRLIHLTTTDISLALLLLPQLEAFRAAGYEVIGVSAPGPYVDTLQAHGIRHVPLHRSTREMDPVGDVASMVEFLRLCRELRPDIVHTHNPKPGLYGRVAARLAGVPVVVNTVHGLYALPTDPWPKRAVVYGLERIAAACSHAELLQNPEDLPVLRRLRIPDERLHVLGNGIDLTRFDPSDRAGLRSEVRSELGYGDDDVIIGAVGRLVEGKGYRELFAAMRHVRRRHPQAQLLVVGPRDDAKPDAIPETIMDGLGDGDGIRFLGLRHDVERLYAAMDLYVLASHREGFPRSAMEAAALQLPIVATDIRGCRQVVDHGHNGLLVPPRAPTALAHALSELVADPTRRASMAEASRAKALASFDDRTQVRITLDIYERLLADSP